jgi:hypothetical protein
VTERSARSALSASLRNWRRHVVAVGVVVAGFAVAAAVGSDVARYGAVLLAFSVWMLWFVLTAVDWIRRADF